MDVMPTIDGLKIAYDVLMQEIASYEEQLLGLSQTIEDLEMSYDGIGEEDRKNEAAMFETQEYMMRKKTQFLHSEVLMRAIDEIVDSTKVVMKNQEADVAEIKGFCRSEYLDRCAEKEGLSSVILHKKEEAQNLAEQIKAFAAEVME